ncbi:serine hydrolase [Patescibacteria group bacterium]|nr:serine hydrolase [Patescibacteria group bacterium]
MRKLTPKIHWSIVILVILLLSGLLPTTKMWSFPVLVNIPPAIKGNPLLDNFQHPPVPVVKAADLPALQASSYIVLDKTTNAIIIAKNPHSRIYPASTTKLATVLTALNTFPLDKVITIKDPYKDGQIMKLEPGEKITVRSLVSALLIYSANDSAHALADHFAGGEPAFVTAMNSLMAKYNLTDTHFVDVDGMHQPDHYSTVYDLGQLGRLAAKNPIVRETVKIPKLTVTDLSGNISHPLTTTDELLGVVPEIEGLKTGWTPEAGGCFIGLVNINNHELVTVVAASADRFGDTKLLIDWLKNNLSYHDYSGDTIESATAGK